MTDASYTDLLNSLNAAIDSGALRPGPDLMDIQGALRSGPLTVETADMLSVFFFGQTGLVAESSNTQDFLNTVATVLSGPRAHESFIVKQVNGKAVVTLTFDNNRAPDFVGGPADDVVAAGYDALAQAAAYFGIVYGIACP